MMNFSENKADSNLANGKIQGVLLDFDGTLTEPFFDWKKIKNEMGIGDMLVLDAIKNATSTEKQRLQNIMECHETASKENAIKAEGCDELLGYLAMRGIPHGVVTNNHRENVLHALLRYGFEIEVITGRECGYYKPSPEPLLITANLLGVEPSGCIFVGDSWIDSSAANGAGMKSIIVSDREAAHEIAPDWHVENLPAALEIIRKLTSI